MNIYEGLSGDIKELLMCIFTLNPNQRPGLNEILNHKWFK
jgi:hypothetical protein